MKEILEKIWEIFKPHRGYCWQTLFLLSLFSALMSAIARGLIGEIIAIIGYLLLIISLAWLGIENHWQLTPWMVAALICLLAWEVLGIPPRILILSWFPLSASIASLGSFINRNLELTLPSPREGQSMMILFATQILLACWVQFYFVYNNWLQQYPTLLTEDFSNSQFVIQLDISSRSPSRSPLILAEIQRLLEREINNRPWTNAQRWLQAIEREDFLANFQKQVLDNLNSFAENSLWKIELQRSTIPSGYQLIVTAQWLGPQSQNSLERDIPQLLCNIRQTEETARTSCEIKSNWSFTSQK